MYSCRDIFTNQYILRMTLAQNKGESRGGTWVAPLFLDQIFLEPGPPFSQSLDDCPPTLLLDPPLQN